MINEKNIRNIKRFFKLIRISIFGYKEDQKINSQNFNFDYDRLLHILCLIKDCGIPLQINIPMFKNMTKKVDLIMEDIRRLDPHEIVFMLLKKQVKKTSC